MQLQWNRVPAFVVLASVSFVMLASPVAAGEYAQNQSPIQSPDPAPPAAEPSAGAADFSEEKLDKAAKAMNNVVSIKQSYQPKIDAAPPGDKERVAGEANEAAVKAVIDEGLTVEEYTAIMRTAQRDPGLRQKILQRLPPSGQ